MRKEEREKLNNVLYLIRDAEAILRDARKIIREARKSSDFRVTEDMIYYAEHVQEDSTKLATSIE